MYALFITLAALAVVWLVWRFVRACRRESARIDDLIADESRWRTAAESPDSEDGNRGLA
jgi:hypothetical protein